MAEKAEDLNLPLTVITRIIKDSLPEGVIVSKEARTAIARAASVFVLHTTNYANQNAVASKRKTITGQDVIEGVKELEMDDFVEPLQAALEAWKENQKSKAATKKKGAKKPEEDQIEEDEPGETSRIGDTDSPIVLDLSGGSSSPSRPKESSREGDDSEISVSNSGVPSGSGGGDVERSGEDEESSSGESSEGEESDDVDASSTTGGQMETEGGEVTD